MPSFNLGFNQRRFNGTTAVSRQAINMGTMRGKGSTSRMFNFCKTHSTNPSDCIDQFITISGGGGGSAPPVPTSSWFYSVSSIPQNLGNWTGAFINSVGLDSTNAQFISIIYPTYQGTSVPPTSIGSSNTVCYIGYDTSPLTGNLIIQPIGFYPSFNGQFNFSYNYTLSDFYPTDAKISINSQNRFAILYNTNNLQTNGAVLTTGGVIYGSNGSITENIIANRYQFPPTPLSFYTYVFTDVYCGYDNISGNEFIIWMGTLPAGTYSDPLINQTVVVIYKIGASYFRQIGLGTQVTPPSPIILSPTIFQPHGIRPSRASCFACSNILGSIDLQSSNCWPKTFIIGTDTSSNSYNYGYIYLYVNINSTDDWVGYTRTRGYINPISGPTTENKPITSIKMKGDGTKIYATTVDGLYYASSNDALYTNLTTTTIDVNTEQYSSNGWSYISWLSLGVSSPINPQLSLSYDGQYLLVVFSSNDKPIRSGNGGTTWQTVNNINGQSGWDSFSQGAVCSVNSNGANQTIGWSYGTGTIPFGTKSSAISNNYGQN